MDLTNQRREWKSSKRKNYLCFLTSMLFQLIIESKFFPFCNISKSKNSYSFIAINNPWFGSTIWITWVVNETCPITTWSCINHSILKMKLLVQKFYGKFRAVFDYQSYYVILKPLRNDYVILKPLCNTKVIM